MSLIMKFMQKKQLFLEVVYKTGKSFSSFSISQTLGKMLKFGLI